MYKAGTATGPVHQPQNYDQHRNAPMIDRLSKEEGFNECVVLKAVDKMWSQGLPHSDYNAVKDFILDQASNQEETKTTSTAEESSSEITLSASDNTGRHTSMGHHVEDDTDDDMDRHEQEANMRQTRDRRSRSQMELERQIVSPPPGHILGIAAKLDLVADYEVLSEAAFALANWVSEVSTPSDVSRCPFCFALFACESCSSSFGRDWTVRQRGRHTPPLFPRRRRTRGFAQVPGVASVPHRFFALRLRFACFAQCPWFFVAVPGLTVIRRLRRERHVCPFSGRDRDGLFRSYWSHRLLPGHVHPGCEVFSTVHSPSLSRLATLHTPICCPALGDSSVSLLYPTF